MFNEFKYINFKKWTKNYIFKKLSVNLKLKNFDKKSTNNIKISNLSYLKNSFINEWYNQYFIELNLYRPTKKLILINFNKILDNKVCIETYSLRIKCFIKFKKFKFYKSYKSVFILNYFFKNLYFVLFHKKLNKMYFICFFIKKVFNCTDKADKVCFFKVYNINNFSKSINYFINANDFYTINKKYFNLTKLKYFNVNSIFSKKLDELLNKKFYHKNHFFYSNYYPVFLLKNNLNDIFIKKFSFFYSGGYNMYLNNFIILFLENILKKSLFIKLINNSFYESYNWYLNSILNEYKFYKPIYFKSYETSDFIKILWYSFFFKDISIFSKWVSIFMETLNFKNHKKFLLFFNNFIKKYSTVFEDVLKVKGFFFDIRGKVGVTGSSKKRHLTIKFGRLNKFSKKNKIDYDLKLVRTYSGVMGLTYII